MEHVETIALRPQPVGLYPGAAGLLVLPPVADPSALVPILLGAFLDHDGPGAALPPEWEFWRRAQQGAADPPSPARTPLERYNAFVLAPASEAYCDLAQTLHGAWRDLLDVAAYVVGVVDAPPAETPSLDGELRALARAARAAWQLDRGAREAAAVELWAAIEDAGEASPLFAAQLQGQLAGLRDDAATAANDIRQALARARDSRSKDLRAGLWTELGILYQERGGQTRGALTEAVRAYQEAVHAGYDASRRPEQYGFLQNNIGLAHLATPMTDAADRLRLAVAVQSFREAARVITPESNPALWTSAQVNLANALQYLPSSHPVENLGKAVAIYETVLAARERDVDPVGYARVLANQANALAHLGGLTVALAKFREARGLASRAGAGDLVDSIGVEIDRLEAHRIKPAPDPAPAAAEARP